MLKGILIYCGISYLWCAIYIIVGIIRIENCKNIKDFIKGVYDIISWKKVILTPLLIPYWINKFITGRSI